MREGEKETKNVIGCIVLSAVIFSTMEVALKIGGGTFDPLQITMIRFLIGGLFLFPFAVRDIRKRGVRLETGDYAYLLFLGVLCICVSMVLFQFGVMRSNASTAAVVFSVNPMFTMFFAHFMTEEKMNGRKGAALLISLAGILIMMNPLHLAEGNTVGGMLCSVLSALTFGFYSAAGKKRIRRIGGMTQTSISFILGALGLAAVMLPVGRPIAQGVSAATLPILLYVGIVVTGLGYFLYFKAIELGGAAKGSMVFFLKPVIAPVIALLVLGEGITLQTVAGVGVLLLGSLINMRTPAPAPTPAQSNLTQSERER